MITKDTTLTIIRTNPDDGSKQQVTLIAEQQTGGRSSKQWYLTIPEDKRDLVSLAQLFGDETIASLAFDALDAKLQQLYFNRAEEDIAKFKVMVEDANLSGREMTPEYCMRKATALMSGNAKKGIAPDMVKAIEWITKSQELTAKMIQEAKQSETQPTT